MRAFTIAAAGSLLLTGSLAHAQESRPPAPQVTTSANLKELVFDWDPVPGAYTYWLLEKPYNPSRRTFFERIQDRIPRTRTRAAVAVAVHDYEWWDTKYAIEACNAAGCTRSAEFGVLDLMLDAIGYIKASNAEAGDRFGQGVILSADGSTLAVSAPGEDSAATGVNGNEADNSSPDNGAVYVFRRTGRVWAQEAYLKPGVSQPGQAFGAAADTPTKTLAISSDGSWLAIGAPARGTTLANAGAVYLFRRDAGGWTLATTLQSTNPTANDQFGLSVDMSLDGRTLKVSSLNPIGRDGIPEGRTHLYTRPADTWQHAVTLAPYHAGDVCPTVRMSTNGSTLLAACRQRSGSYAISLRRFGDAWLPIAESPMSGVATPGQLMALDHHATRLWIAERGTLARYQWANGTWVRGTAQGQIGPPGSVEFDSAGDNAAYADIRSDLAGEGPVRNYFAGGNQHGAVLTFRWHAAANPAHQPRFLLKAPNPDYLDGFGTSMSFSGNGRIFAVGAPGEDSAARGIDGDRTDNSAVDAGAVYLY